MEALRQHPILVDIDVGLLFDDRLNLVGCSINLVSHGMGQIKKREVRLLMWIRKLFLLFFLGLASFLTACWADPRTPFDALTEFPGFLEGTDDARKNSIQLIREEEAAGGVIMLYNVPDEENGEQTLVVTFVMPERFGWGAQSSGWEKYQKSDDFVLSYLAGGNVTDLTAVCGISKKGEDIRVLLFDGQVDIHPIVDNSFILARPQTLTVQLVELLDEGRNVLESEEFP